MSFMKYWYPVLSVGQKSTDHVGGVCNEDFGYQSFVKVVLGLDGS